MVGTPIINGPVVASSVDQYVSGNQLLLPGTWRTALARDGFVTAAKIQFKQGDSLVDAEALRFASPARAAEFNHDTELAMCSARITRMLTPVAGAPGAIVSTYHDVGIPPYRASLVLGDTVVHLNVCHCAVPKGSSPLDVTAGWARAVYLQMTGPS